MQDNTTSGGVFRRSAVALMVVSLGMGTVFAVAPPASATTTGSDQASVSARYEQQVTVAGSVRTSDGVPFAGVPWEVTDAAGDTQKGSTSAAGAFSFEADATREAKITFGSMWSGALRGTVSVPAGQTKLAIVTGQAHVATIEVVDALGAPLRNARVDLPQALRDATWDVPGHPTLKVHGPIAPSYYYGSGTTSPDGMVPVRITTAGARPDLPDGILGTVVTTTSPGVGMATGTTVTHAVKVSELTGSDPLDRRVRITSSLAPIMEDARIAGAIPAAPSNSATGATSAPQVIVRKPDGTPIPNVPVQLVRVLDADTPEAPKEDTSLLRTATTGADGKASFNYTESLPSGRYRAIPTPYSGVSSRTVDFMIKSTVSAPSFYSVEAGDGSAHLSWSWPYNSNGVQPTGYTVTSEPGGGSCETTGAWQTSCTVEGLDNGTEYRFTVTAHYADGTDSVSALSAPITPQPVPVLDTQTRHYPADASPFKFQLTERRLVTMTVSGLEGEASEDESGFTIIPDGGYWHNGAHASRNGVHRVVLEPGVYRAYGAWPASTPWSVHLATSAVPADLAGDTTDDAQALPFGAPVQDTISWASTGGWEEPWVVSDADVYRVEMPHKGRIEAELTDLPEDYDLTLLGGKGGTIEVSSNAGTSGELISRPVAAGTYYLRVASETGTSSDSPYTIVAHATAGTPAAPTVTVDQTTATLAWSKPDSTGGLPIQGYRIERKTGSGDWETAIRDTASSGTTVTIDGLSTETPTQFRVAAINAIGTSEASAASQPVTGQVAPPVVTPPVVTPPVRDTSGRDASGGDASGGDASGGPGAGQVGQQWEQAACGRQPEHGQGALDVQGPVQGRPRSVEDLPHDVQDVRQLRDEHREPATRYLPRRGQPEVRLPGHHLQRGVPAQVAVSHSRGGGSPGWGSPTTDAFPGPGFWDRRHALSVGAWVVGLPCEYGMHPRVQPDARAAGRTGRTFVGRVPVDLPSHDQIHAPSTSGPRRTISGSLMIKRRRGIVGSSYPGSTWRDIGTGKTVATELPTQGEQNIMKKIATLGVVAVALALSACAAPADAPEPQATVTVTAEPTPVETESEPTPEETELEATPEETEEADDQSVGMSAAAFAVSARGDIKELRKDAGDAQVALDDGGTLRLITNGGEMSFNLGQLQALEAPQSVATEWNRELKKLDKAVTAYTEAVSGDSVSKIQKSIDAVERSCDTLLDIAEAAAP